ncbi:MAG: hypothetical protein HFG37_05190 [Eubacterium sp.]|nr:hypothetical protein [Eubacterium sp.]
MKLKIYFPDNYKREQIHLFKVESNNRLEKTGYRAGIRELVSTQKKDGYLYVEIDDNTEVEIVDINT